MSGRCGNGGGCVGCFGVSSIVTHSSCSGIDSGMDSVPKVPLKEDDQ